MDSGRVNLARGFAYLLVDNMFSADIRECGAVVVEIRTRCEGGR